MRWTDSDNLQSRDASIIGGSLDGLRVAVREQRGRYRYPAVFDLSSYVFDSEGWQFVETKD